MSFYFKALFRSQYYTPSTYYSELAIVSIPVFALFLRYGQFSASGYFWL